ncbi:MFS transporter [Methylosinus sp. H3A]|uniref:MFS transporter n=1 Tax=Methylosinus sp. H3A TaxID=2785786 RepID=UPI0018C2025F|nr:MFS transporter [Methylosinus sp. H3A]MBG0809971.1 MFS transporter [Methylosinus sp. H3A]
MAFFLPGKNGIALAAVCLAALMFGLEISSVPVILPILETALVGDFRDMQWIMNAYTIACTSVLMAAGTLADRYGRKRVFVLSLILFGATSLVCGLAQSVPLLIAGRFLQGIGGGAMLICLIAILSHQFSEGKERSRAFGVWGIIFGVGLGFGPIIGGGIVALVGWQWVFLIHAPLTLVTLLLVFRSVEESRDPQAKTLDSIGVVTLPLAVLGLVFFITQGSELGFGSSAALGILGAATVSLIVFFVAEIRNPHPMFDFSVFRIRNFSGALFGSVGMNFSFWPFMIYLPIYFQNVLGYDAVAAGLALLAYTLPTLLLPPVAERLSLRYQPRIVIPAGLFVIGSGFILMKLGSSAVEASWLTMLPGSLVAGIGLGLTNTPVTNTTTGSVPSARAGMASGIDMSARLITLAINIAVMGLVLQDGILSHLHDLLPDSDPQTLRTLASKLAAGGVALAETVAPADALRGALEHGFGLVMLYGGLGIWIFAAFSAVTFGRGRAASRRGTPIETSPSVDNRSN